MRALFLFCIIPGCLWAQTAVDSVAAQWAEQQEAEPELVEILQQLTAHPININTAEEKDLQALPLLSSEQIAQILDWRKQHGAFQSIRTLKKILGTETYRLLKPFFTVKTKTKKGFLKQTTYYPLDLPSAAQNYKGGLWYHKTRLTYPVSPNLRFGMLAHKDIGEKNLFDFYSGYLAWQQKGWLLIGGRFRYQFGQGLLFANPFSAQKSALVLSPVQENHSLGRPTLSSSENSNFNGLYLELPQFQKIDLRLFYSQTARDGRINLDDNTVSALDYDGYHRTASEVAVKAQVQEINAVMSMRRTFTAAELSALSAITRYDPGFGGPRDEAGRDYFKLTGQRLMQYSLALNWHLSDIRGSGELAVSQPGGTGWIQNIRAGKEPLRFGFSFWNLDKNFQAPHGSVLGDISPFPRAQSGIYGALELDLREDLQFKMYRFMRRETWRGYFYNLPQPASEWFTQLTFKQPQRTFYLRLQQQTIPSTFSNGVEKPQKKYYRGRIQYSWKPDRMWRLRVRLTHNRYENQHGHGTAIFQELRYQPHKRLRIYGRMTFFRTEGSGILLYEYENDVPGSFANYSMSGEGYKWYLMLWMQPWKPLRLWLKWRHYRRYRDLENSKLLRREIRLQAEIFF